MAGAAAKAAFATPLSRPLWRRWVASRPGWECGGEEDSAADAREGAYEAYGEDLRGGSYGALCRGLIIAGIAQEVKRCGLRFAQHTKAPPGDGGIALGQAYLASLG